MRISFWKWFVFLFFLIPSLINPPIFKLISIIKNKSNFGEIEDIVVCDNIGDHLIGNVYVKFVYDDDAKACKDGLTGRYYGGNFLRNFNFFSFCFFFCIFVMSQKKK